MTFIIIDLQLLIVLVYMVNKFFNVKGKKIIHIKKKLIIKYIILPGIKKGEIKR